MRLRTLLASAVLATRATICPAEPPNQLLWEVRGGQLVKLEYGAVSLLAGGKYGAPGLFRAPVFHPSGSSPGSESPAVEKQNDALVQRFSWGTITLAPGGNGSGSGGLVTWAVKIQNQSAEEIAELAVRLAVLQFPEVPTGAVLEPGMFGYGGEAPMKGTPMIAGKDASPPVIAIISRVCRLAFCLDDSGDEARVEIPFPVDQGAGLVQPLIVRVFGVKAGARRAVQASLRFSPPEPKLPAADFSIARDVLDSFAGRHPMRLHWKDRRSIGMIMAASSGLHEPGTNPRRWIIGHGRHREVIDVRELEGRERFARRLLQFADGSVEILKEAGSQGVIVWDIEGQEHPRANYVGEPHLIGRLAPEMETPVPDRPGAAPRPVVDVFFKRFADSGLRTGVCLRAQRLETSQGNPRQVETNSAEAYENLRRDLFYARKRWGCTLFYIDSTYDSETRQPLAPWVFERLHEEFPDVLLLPENQALRYYAVSAPIDSFFHHKVGITPPKVRQLWPGAFSGLLASEGAKVSGPAEPAVDRAQRLAGLVEAAKAGDILLFSAWYRNPGTEDIKAISRDGGSHE